VAITGGFWVATGGRSAASARRWYQKKYAQGLTVVAIKAVAHKLARACYERVGQEKNGDDRSAVIVPIDGDG
jgi:hypothetical protein